MLKLYQKRIMRRSKNWIFTDQSGDDLTEIMSNIEKQTVNCYNSVERNLLSRLVWRGKRWLVTHFSSTKLSHYYQVILQKKISREINSQWEYNLNEEIWNKGKFGLGVETEIITFFDDFVYQLYWEFRKIIRSSLDDPRVDNINKVPKVLRPI